MSDPFAYSRARGGGPQQEGRTGGVAPPQAWDAPHTQWQGGGMQQQNDAFVQGSMGTMGPAGAFPAGSSAYGVQPVYPTLPALAGGQYPAGLATGVPTSGDPFTAGLAANPMAQLGMQYAQQAVAQGITRYMPGASMLWLALRYYFDVSNSYVLAKLRRVVFPFRSKKWSRLSVADSGHPPRHAPSEGGTAHAPPCHDENAPDLYIPLMAFITFILLVGLHRGILKTFHPEVLVQTSSKALVTAILELAVVKGGMYVLSVDAAPLLDLLAYSGYKYVGLCIVAVVSLAMGSMFAVGALLYTGIAAAFFLINTLMPVVRPETYTGGPSGAASPPSRSVVSQRNYFVVLAGLMQLFLMWFLSI